MDETPQETTSENTSASSGGNNTVKIIGVIVVIIVLAFLVWQFALKPKSENESMEQVSTPTPSAGASMEVSPTAVVAATYKDGTYSAIGEYQNPASREQVNVSITLKGGAVTAATFTGTPDNPTAVTMQNRFKQGFSALVVGKPIDEINLTVVNGSSLTPKGFMDALTKIKEQAKG